MNELEKTKEKIKYYLEVLKLLAATFVATMGGVISFIVGDPGAKHVIFIAFGLVISVSLICVIVSVNKSIKRLINGL